MDDALLVRGAERQRDQPGDPYCLDRRQRATGDDLRQRRALDQLHHEIVGPDVVERADVGMVQRRHGARLPLEPCAEAVAANLDRDRALQTRIARRVHVPHTACANRVQDFVGTETRA